VAEGAADCLEVSPPRLPVVVVPVVVESSAALSSNDAGPQVVRLNERIGLTARFADALQETRDPPRPQRIRTRRMRTR
jgi:hypothetical protein